MTLAAELEVDMEQIMLGTKEKSIVIQKAKENIVNIINVVNEIIDSLGAKLAYFPIKF